ncbi:MAG: hypothetical protein FWE46_03615 [Coriobacteriia bacterium]|nr:hypothetical protein [Coriobacteriia bacterium]MCL2537388.1 hypothetical protein [Coriobacteriia bacterium]
MSDEAKKAIADFKKKMKGIPGEEFDSWPLEEQQAKLTRWKVESDYYYYDTKVLITDLYDLQGPKRVEIDEVEHTTGPSDFIFYELKPPAGKE